MTRWDSYAAEVADEDRATTYIPRFVSLLAALVIGGIGGLLMSFSFPGYSVFTYLGIAAIMWIALNLRGVSAFIGITIWAISFFLPLLSWIKISTSSASPWIALTIIQVLWILLWGSAAIISRRKIMLGHPLVYCLFLVLGFAGIEQLRAHFPWGGFAWALLGYSQVDSWFAPLIPHLGEAGMAVLVSLIGLLIALSFSVISKWWVKAVSLALCACIFVGAGFGLPHISQQLSQAKAPLSDPQTIAVTAIQGNISTNYRADFAKPYHVLTNNVQETVASGKGSELVVWGEQSADIDPRQDPTAQNLVTRAATAADASLIIGTVPVKGREYRTNDLLVVSPAGEVLGSYSKQRPVPFGEYIPARSFFSKLTSDVNQVPVDMRAGTKPAMLPVTLKNGRQVKLALGICFEVAVDQIMHQGVAAGGQLFVIPTNNSSFGYSDESVQQLQIARFRALEYHRSVVAASLNGVSALIKPDGHVVMRTELFTKTSIHAKLPLHDDRTAASHLQPIAPWVAMGIAVIWLLWAFFAPRRSVRVL